MGKSNLILAIVIIMAICLAGCNKTEKAAAKARESFAALRNAEQGVKAEALAKEVKNLKPEKLNEKDWFVAVGIANKDELAKFVQEAWWKEGRMHLNEMRQLSANPARATELRAAFLNAQAKSGEPITSFGTSTIGINRIVMMNKLRDARRDGSPTASDLKSAGISVPTKVVTKTVATKPAPIAKKAQKKTKDHMKTLAAAK